MKTWNTFLTPPRKGERIIVLYWRPEGRTYDMDIFAWHGWSQVEMDHLGVGYDTFPVAWMVAPAYPEIPDQDIPNNG